MITISIDHDIINHYLEMNGIGSLKELIHYRMLSNRNYTKIKKTRISRGKTSIIEKAVVKMAVNKLLCFSHDCVTIIFHCPACSDDARLMNCVAH